MHNQGRHLPDSEERDGFRFRGGHPAIDLTATLQGRLKPMPRDLLGGPADLARWLVASRLTRTAPLADEEDLADAKRLREAIFNLAAARSSGRPYPDEDRILLNGLARRAPAATQLSQEGEAELSGSAGSLVATLARSAVRLLGSDNASHVRQCQSPTCTLFFIDNRRGGDRRWCSMSACGNKAKVAEFRRRQRQHPE